MKSEIVAVFVFPATSLATPSATENLAMPAVPPAPVAFEATKLIKEFRPNLPIVSQTAYTTNEDKEKAFSAGCDDFISKPISEETLNEIMNKYLITK